MICKGCRAHRNKCVWYGRNSLGEIKGRDRNVPVAIFNGVGHSIHEHLDAHDRRWVEAIIRVIEGSSEATNLVSVNLDALSQHIRRERRLKIGSSRRVSVQFYPEAAGPTNFTLDPASLPKYSARNLPPLTKFKGGQQLEGSPGETEGSTSVEEKSTPFLRKRGRDEQAPSKTSKGKKKARAEPEAVDVDSTAVSSVKMVVPSTAIGEPSESRFNEAQTTHPGDISLSIHPHITLPHVDSDDGFDVGRPGDLSDFETATTGGRRTPSDDYGLVDGVVAANTPAAHEVTNEPLASLSADDSPVEGVSYVRNHVDLHRLLAQWREQGSQPLDITQHSAFAIHIGALRTAHATAMSRELTAVSDQRRYMDAEMRLTGMPFGAFHNDWVGTYNPAWHRELYEELGVDPSSGGLSFADASRHHTGNLRDVGPSSLPADSAADFHH